MTLPDDYVGKAALPNDNPEAAAARDRRSEGLVVATGGYLTASRAKDVAPGMADLLTRSAKSIGPAKRAALTSARKAKFGRWGGIGGAATIGAGLTVAGQGAIKDSLARKAPQRAKKRVKDTVQEKVQERRLVKSEFSDDYDVTKGIGSFLGGMSSKVTSGAGKLGGHLKPVRSAVGGAFKSTPAGATAPTIGARLKPVGTAVNDAVKPIKAKAASLDFRPAKFTPQGIRPTAAGVGYMAGAGGAVAGYGMHRNNVNKVDDRVRQAVLNKAFESPLRLPRDKQELLWGNPDTTDRQALAGGAVLGGAMGGGSAYAMGARKGRLLVPVALGSGIGAAINRSAQPIRRRGGLKKAFNSERDRRARQDMYAGAASGGAVVGGAGSVTAGVGAHRAKQAAKASGRGAATSWKAANEAHLGVQTQLRNISQTANANPPLPVNPKHHIDVRASHVAAMKHEKTAGEHGLAQLKQAGRARKLTRVSRGSAAAAATLGAAAYGAHTYDRRHDGRTYGY